MNIFITGATGAIGKSLVLKLLQNSSINVFALVRSTSDTTSFPQVKNLHVIRCDFLNKKQLKNIFRNTKVDFFVHLAARVSSWGSKDDFINDNVLITENILDALSGALDSESVFIYASTIAVYGFENNNCVENSNLALTGWNYADSKILAEQKIISYLGKINVKSIILRIGDIASDETSWVSGVQSESKMGFFISPKTGGTMYFLCIDDVVQLFIKIFECKHISQGIYNVVGEHKVPFIYFFEQLTRQLDIKMIKFPTQFLLPLSYLNVFVCRMLNRKTELTPETTRYILGQRKISAEKTIEEFDWNPNTFCYNNYIKEPMAPN